MNRLKGRYLSEVVPALRKELDYSNPMEVPRVTRVNVNMGVGAAVRDAALLDAAMEQLGLITGQKPRLRRAKKSIQAFNRLRAGNPVGCAVTLRGERMYEFLDRLFSVALPRIRDFRGLSPNSFDGHGNYSFGLTEQIIFPEIDYDKVDRVRGMDITIVTNAGNDQAARALLTRLGLPLRAH